MNGGGVKRSRIYMRGHSESFRKSPKEIRKCRERERERQSNHSPTIPNSRQPVNDKIINELTAKKQQLQAKIKELEQQLKNQQFSGEEKKIKESELNASRKLLNERDKELEELRKKSPNQPTNTEKDNNKLN